MRKWIALAISFLLFIPFMNIDSKNVSTATNAGGILYVGGDGEGNYSSIQDAINDAKDGDTIFVYSGVYYENVIVDKSISLIGENRNNTIIDGMSKENVISLVTNGIKISNFTLRNSGKSKAGIAIYSANNSISNCNTFMNGYGILLDSADNNRIWNCDTFSNSNGIKLDISSNNVIAGCNISDNGLGINMHASNKNCISDCTILNNEWDGISSRMDNGNTIFDCIISSNLNGIYLYLSHYMVISNCSIISNEWSGMQVVYSVGNLVSKSNISHNINGIEIGGSFNIVRGCNICNNKRGVVILYAFFNLIKKNNFIGNNLHATFYNSFFNRWSRNYWDDWWGLLPRPIIGKIIVATMICNITIAPLLAFDWLPTIKPW